MHRKPKVDQHVCTLPKTLGLNSCAPEGQVVYALLVATIVFMTGKPMLNRIMCCHNRGKGDEAGTTKSWHLWYRISVNVGYQTIFQKIT